jgi:hypothetical protein
MPTLDVLNLLLLEFSTYLHRTVTDHVVCFCRNETFADMARAAWRLKLRKIALQCCELALEGNIVSKILKVRFCSAGVSCLCCSSELYAVRIGKCVVIELLL